MARLVNKCCSRFFVVHTSTKSFNKAPKKFCTRIYNSLSFRLFTTYIDDLIIYVSVSWFLRMSFPYWRRELVPTKSNQHYVPILDAPFHGYPPFFQIEMVNSPVTTVKPYIDLVVGSFNNLNIRIRIRRQLHWCFWFQTYVDTNFCFDIVFIYFTSINNRLNEFLPPWYFTSQFSVFSKRF